MPCKFQFRTRKPGRQKKTQAYKDVELPRLSMTLKKMVGQLVITKKKELGHDFFFCAMVLTILLSPGEVARQIGEAYD